MEQFGIWYRIHVLLNPFGHATAVMQSDDPRHFQHHHILPAMYKLRKDMHVDAVWSAFAPGTEATNKTKIRAADLHPAAARLRQNLANEFELNWRWHIFHNNNIKNHNNNHHDNDDNDDIHNLYLNINLFFKFFFKF